MVIKNILFRFSVSKTARPLWNWFYTLLNPLTKSSFIAKRPAVYFFYARHFKPDTFWELPGPETDICIEGAGGCATHALVAYVRKHNPSINIAHTCEVPATVRYSVAHGIPTIVPVRNVLEYMTSVTTRFSHLSRRNALKAYCTFYAEIWPMRDHYVIADFNRLLKEPRSIVEECNQMFGKNFHTGDNVLPKIKTTMNFELASPPKKKLVI